MIRSRHQHGTRTLNRHGNNIRVRLFGQNKASTLKGPDASVQAGCTFRKEHQRSSRPKLLTRTAKGFDGRVRIMSIHSHVPRPAKMPSQERDSKQLLLCSKAKGNRKSGKDDRDVHVTLVIDEKHVRNIVTKIRIAADLYTNPADRQYHAGPKPRASVLNSSGRIKDRTDERERPHEASGDENQRCRNKKRTRVTQPFKKRRHALQTVARCELHR